MRRTLLINKTAKNSKIYIKDVKNFTVCGGRAIRPAKKITSFSFSLIWPPFHPR
jgi:hypothetical protein